MQCNNPITLIGKASVESKERLVVPCGKCLGCKIAKAREWSIRMLHELDSWSDNVFMTLTYNDDNLPKNNSISVEELKLFWKRLRKNLNRKIKYYACGEYGEKKCRPHYHGIVFGVSLEEHRIISNGNRKGIVISGPLVESWKLGDVHIGTVTYESARYVARYIEKKYYGVKAKEVYLDLGLEIPFQVVSRGLGLEYVNKNKLKLEKDCYINLRGNKISLPRYYKQKLDIDKDIYEQMAVDAKELQKIKIMNQGILDADSIEKAIKEQYKQREENFSSKEKLFKRQSIL